MCRVQFRFASATACLFVLSCGNYVAFSGGIASLSSQHSDRAGCLTPASCAQPEATSVERGAIDVAAPSRGHGVEMLTPSALDLPATDPATAAWVPYLENPTIKSEKGWIQFELDALE